MFGKLTGSFYQMNSRQTKKIFFFDNFQRASSPARPLTDLKATSVSSTQARTWRSAPLRCGQPLWMLISYSIRAKTASNLLIYLQARADSLSLRLTDALADTFGGWWRRRLSHRGAPTVCLWWGERRGGGDGGSGGGGEGGGDAALSKTKQGRGRKQFKSEYWSGTSDCTYIPQSHRSHSCVS